VIRLIDMFELGLYATIAPWVMLIVSKVWQYPAVLEEIIKMLILRAPLGGQGELRVGWVRGLVVGLAFGLSEAVLYTIPVWSSGDWSVMVARLAMTVPMHMIGGIVIGVAVERRIAIVGLVVAMLMHGLFNSLI